MTATQLAYCLCVVLTALVAGLFYGYQCSVINGLGALSDREYLSAFQSISREILNPLFFSSFMGTLVVFPIAAYLIYKSGQQNVLPFVLTSFALYFIGVFLITGVCNVPLNESLANFDIAESSTTELQAMRKSFEPAWNQWHLIRTIASICAFVILLIPLLKKSLVQ